MRQKGSRNYALESVAGPDDSVSGRYIDSDEFADLTNAVSALTRDELSGLSASLNAADAWDIDDTGGHCGSGFLANQF